MRHIIKKTALLFLLLSTVACNESSWLSEKPLDFYAPENSYENTSQFNQALNYLYDNVRSFQVNITGGATMSLYDISDLCFHGSYFPNENVDDYKTFIIPTANHPKEVWAIAYMNICNANIILKRIDAAAKVSDADKKIIKGEALLFRAYWFRFLANLYGGVPIALEESVEPKRDYVRATRTEVYQQCRTDLVEAIGLLPDIDKVKDGKVSKQVAQHIIAEVYISLQQYKQAIEAASSVINHPAMGLMTERFGSKQTEPGDPYWDLFQLGNQNRGSGNREALWVLQYEYQSSGSRHCYTFPRYGLPEYYNAKVKAKDGGLVPAFTNFTAQKGGRGIGNMQGTHHFFHGIWGKDFDKDYRNSSYIIMRDFKIDNPRAEGYGQWMAKDGWVMDVDTIRRWYPFVMKFSRVGNFPEESYEKNPDGSRKKTALGEDVLLNQSGSANNSFMDTYLFRLAGTYLLRAEAYLGDNQKEMAAADLNKLRARAGATPTESSEVTLDYILDEQLRELYFEEFRIPTLCRLGKMVERTQRYNPIGYNVADHQNLWPIPYNEIERNLFNKLEQNPGY